MNEWNKEEVLTKEKVKISSNLLKDALKSKEKQSLTKVSAQPLGYE